MSAWSRRRVEVLLLAVIGIASVAPTRFPVESPVWFIAEMAALALCVVIGLLVSAGRTRWRSAARSAVAALLVVPLVFAVLARLFGSPIAIEMTVLSMFGAASLAMALASSRTAAMSLVSSGFLVLFATSISDRSLAMWFPMLWLILCLWHLVANHWERLDLCMPDTVRPGFGVRPASVVFAAVLVFAGVFVVRDRVGDSNRFQSGFMPTSGGSKWSDPAARSGIGTGDAAIAAKDRAESFGAVDSDVFLESNEPTLFDMFNDLIGEPKTNNRRRERAQAMGNETFIPSHQRTAKSEQGGNAFSTDRKPTKKHLHHDDASDPAVIQWDGPTGIRLAMQRYNAFDGVDWTNTANWRRDQLVRRNIETNAWFFDPKSLRDAVEGEQDKVAVNLLKVIRLNSHRLPVPMMTGGVHIKDIDRQDFFGVERDGSFCMPGREKVPPLTVVHVASAVVSEDDLWAGLDSVAKRETAGYQSAEPTERQPPWKAAVRRRAAEICGDLEHPYQKLRAIVDHLRETFVVDDQMVLESQSPISEFLAKRRGGKHLFATAAALLAREAGLRSRLVTGFYVRPDAYDLAAGHASILPSDVHVWVEVKLDDGRWFEVEPTPGFREPVYRPSLWLTAKQIVVGHWHHGLAFCLVLAVVHRTRRWWIDWSLGGIWWSVGWLRPSVQLPIAMRIVETRARLAGRNRPPGRPQRDWIESLTRSDARLHGISKEFFDSADRFVFGGGVQPDRRAVARFVRSLTTRNLGQLAPSTQP